MGRSRCSARSRGGRWHRRQVPQPVDIGRELAGQALTDDEADLFQALGYAVSIKTTGYTISWRNP